jgi:hypothetical protein
MPSGGKAAHAVAPTRRIEYSLHASIMPIVA